VDGHLTTVGVALLAAVLLAANQVCGRIGMQYGTAPQSWLVVFSATAIVIMGLAMVVAPRPFQLSAQAAFMFLLDGLLFASAAGLMLVSGVKVGPSTASAVKNAAPVPAILLAIPLLGELPGPAEVIGTALIVGGVILLSGQAGGRGRSRYWRPAMVYPIVMMLFFAVNSVVRKAGLPLVAHPMIGGSVAGVTMALFGIVAFILTRSKPPSTRAFWWFVLTGSVSGFAYFAVITALNSGSVAVVVPIYTSSPIFVVLASRLFLGHLERLTPRVVTGVLTVFIGIVVISLFGG
jgi:drug/metabolite transporter (DMT)-like permease